MNKEEIYARLDPGDIDMLARIVEAYDHLGVLSTLDPAAGLVVIRVTEDTWEEMRLVLEDLPFPISLIS